MTLRTRWSHLVSALSLRISPENPTTNLANPALWLSEAFGAAPSTSGVAVTPTTAMTYASFWACVNVLSKDIAQLPIFVYRREGEERTVDRTHPLWRPLHDRPNPMMTPMTLKQTLQAHACAWGNGYAEIETNGAGDVVHLWPLLPDRTRVIVKDKEKVILTWVRDERGTVPLNDALLNPAGPLASPTVMGKWVSLPASRVLHVMGLGFDGLKGYSVLTMARNAIGAGLGAEEFTARMFKNSAMPRMALRHPKALTPQARDNLRNSWNAAYEGLTNAHRTAILEEGIEVEKLGLSAVDAEMIETSKFGIEQMARFFDIPKSRLHSSEGVTSWGTGLEQWQRAYLVHTLGPWIVQWEEALNWSCVRESERPTIFAEFLREGLLQADVAARAQFYSGLFNLGAMSPNQIARKENLPTSGPEGDKRFIPLNMIPLEDAGKDLIEAPTGGDDPPEEKSRVTLELRQQRAATSRQRLQGSYRRIFQQIAERLVAKHVDRVGRAVKRLRDDGNVVAFTGWVREFFAAEESTIRDAFLPATIGLGELVADDVAQELGAKTAFQEEVERFANQYVEALAKRDTGASIGQLVKIANDGDTKDGTVADRVTTRLAEWTTDRPTQIAVAETVQAGCAMARHLYKYSGVQRLVWVTAGAETCEICQSMNGRTVAINAPFVENGQQVGDADKSITPARSIAHPPLHVGCVCQLVAA